MTRRTLAILEWTLVATTWLAIAISFTHPPLSDLAQPWLLIALGVATGFVLLIRISDRR